MVYNRLMHKFVKISLKSSTQIASDSWILNAFYRIGLYFMDGIFEERNIYLVVRVVVCVPNSNSIQWVECVIQ